MTTTETKRPDHECPDLHELKQTVEDTTFLALLHQKIGTRTADGYRGIRTSGGLLWIKSFTGAFLRRLERENTTAAEFFALHLENDELAALVFSNETLWRALGNQLTALTKAMFLASGGYLPHQWLTTALELGIEQSALTEMILQKLGQDTGNFAQHFVQQGAGPIKFTENGKHLLFEERDTYWSMLRRGELWQALADIVKENPRIIFGYSGDMRFSIFRKLRLRLSEEESLNLLRIGLYMLGDDVIQLSDFIGWNGTFSELPFYMQLELLREYMPTSEQVILLAVQLSEEDGLALLREFEVTFSYKPVQAYKMWRELSHGARRKIELEIERLLTDAIRAEGYLIGRMSEATVTNRRQETFKQLQVNLRGLGTYVLPRPKHHQPPTYTCIDTGAPTRLPKIGDLVVFHRDASRQLGGGKLFAVHMDLIWSA